MGRPATGRTGARFGAPARRSRHTPDPETEQEPEPGADGTGGVAMVLIDDLATEGRLRVHLGLDPNGGPDTALLDRVLSGLRRL